MTKLIDLNTPEIKCIISALLRDRTTNTNIVFATDNYSGQGYNFQDPITKEALYGDNAIDLKPRVEKTKEAQMARSKAKAEVFTPSWICNVMNNNVDESWFGRPNVFNTTFPNKQWLTKLNPITFPEGKSWQDYVLLTQLEITCGEAPYLVSRYDTTTGEIIPVQERIGLLDRKLRIINENTKDEKEWICWVIKAYQCTYGYEFQGDNLLIARINLLLTFYDNLDYKWHRRPTANEISIIADFISYNLWQMDGLKHTIPGTDIYSKIQDWKACEELYFKDMLPDPETKQKKRTSKKSK